MLTEEYKQKNVDRVLDVALKMCKELGISAVNKTNLAEAAGLSSKSIKRYFNSKSDMIFIVSHRLLMQMNSELLENIRKLHLSQSEGITQLRIFLKEHNTYLLYRYKDNVFLQNADSYCRYSGESPDRYWNYFRNSELLEKNIWKLMERGIKDKTIDETVANRKFANIMAVILAGLIDRLSTDIDCQIMTVEEAIGISNIWIEHSTSHLQRK